MVKAVTANIHGLSIAKMAEHGVAELKCLVADCGPTVGELNVFWSLTVGPLSAS